MTEPEYQESLPSVGDTLKSLREQKNFGTIDIANNLHLDTKVIEALEQDNYEKLPDPIYVRGYIRNYSKFVGGDANALVKLYDRQRIANEPEIIPEIKHPSQTSSSDKPVKAFTYLLTLVLVILLIAWWQGNFVVRVPKQAVITDISEPVIPEALPEAVILEEYEDLFPPDTPLTVTDQDNLDPEFSTDLGYIDLPENNQPIIEETISTINELSEDANIEPDNRKFTLEASGPDTINLTLAADSWIEIIDVDNNRVFIGLGRRGETYDLYGTAPFSVLLGFAQGVNIKLNDSPFDPAPYSRAGIARFTLEQ